MDSLAPIISQFHPIGLDEMDAVKLMDRRDTKFLFKASQLPLILKELQKSYKIMEIGTKRLQHYVSLYFDTDLFKFYLDHHNGKLNRYKVRYRKYTDSNLHFLEVKFKNNKGTTRKKRIKIEPGQFKKEGLFKEGLAFVQKRMNYEPGTLTPKLFVEYSRMALVHKGLKERATIDINLSYRNGADKTLEKVVIAEVKQDMLSLSSDFIQLMKNLRIFNVRFSKYCFGINLLYPHVKYNRFKPRMLAYNKIAYGTA